MRRSKRKQAVVPDDPPMVGRRRGKGLKLPVKDLRVWLEEERAVMKSAELAVGYGTRVEL